MSDVSALIAATATAMSGARERPSANSFTTAASLMLPAAGGAAGAASGGGGGEGVASRKAGGRRAGRTRAAARSGRRRRAQRAARRAQRAARRLRARRGRRRQPWPPPGRAPGSAVLKPSFIRDSAPRGGMVDARSGPRAAAGLPRRCQWLGRRAAECLGPHKAGLPRKAGLGRAGAGLWAGGGVWIVLQVANGPGRAGRERVKPQRAGGRAAGLPPAAVRRPPHWATGAGVQCAQRGRPGEAMQGYAEKRVQRGFTRAGRYHRLKSRP
jgi:hypothetical protein